MEKSNINYCALDVQEINADIIDAGIIAANVATNNKFSESSITAENFDFLPMQVKVINVSDNPLPAYQTQGSAGMDLHANLDEPVKIHAGDVAIIPLGIKVQIPEGYEMQVRPRSGLAAKHGVTVLNSPGTIDSDFRAEVGVILINHGKKSFTVSHGDRIAQAVINRVHQVKWKEVDELGGTDRGSGGLGSTGVK